MLGVSLNIHHIFNLTIKLDGRILSPCCARLCSRASARICFGAIIEQQNCVDLCTEIQSRHSFQQKRIVPPPVTNHNTSTAINKMLRQSNQVKRVLSAVLKSNNAHNRHHYYHHRNGLVRLQSASHHALLSSSIAHQHRSLSSTAIQHTTAYRQTEQQTPQPDTATEPQLRVPLAVQSTASPQSKVVPLAVSLVVHSQYIVYRRL